MTKMNNMIAKGIVAALFLARASWGHEGHDIPGALPPAPHGGVIQEAAETGQAHDHAHGKDETELFFEVTYQNNEITVYPLGLLPEKTKAFVPVSAKNALARVTLKAELPRSKKIENLTPKIEEEAIRASFDSKGANRFLVHIGAQFEKESRVAKVQIEKK